MVTNINTPMENLIRRLEDISEWSGRATAWLTLFMVIITFLVVVLRYLFNTGWIALQESITYMHAFVFLLGAAYTLKHEGHVRVDIFYRKLSPQGRALVDLLGVIFLLLPVVLFITVASWDYVLNAWELREGSPEAGGLPFVYVLKSAMLLMTSLLLLQGLALLLRSCLNLRQPQEKSGTP